MVRSSVTQEIYMPFEGEVIALPNTKWSSLIVLASKNDVSLGFSASYRRPSMVTFKASDILPTMTE